MTALLALTLSGCIAKAVVSVATAPARMASRAADLATTSQSEADEKRGRELRRSEERLGRLERSQERHARQCARGDDTACTLAEAESAEIDGYRQP